MPKIPSRAKLPKPGPDKTVREQARKRREAKRDGLDPAKVSLSEFLEVFCVEYVRTGLLEESHRMAEVLARVPLDTTGYTVEEVTGSLKGTKELRFIDSRGQLVAENDLRRARAAHLLYLPEVKDRLHTLRREMAERIDVTAKSLAEKIGLVFGHAIHQGQLQVATNLIAMEAKMFGIEAGPGDPDKAPPATAVEIRIRDYTGKPIDRED